MAFLDTRFAAMAHRGFSPSGLENSMAAFEAAVELGYRYVETDVRTTRDGVLLAFHDLTLGRVTGIEAAVRDLTYAQVRRARIGGVEPIPRLEEVLQRWRHLRVNIDVKSARSALPLVDLVERLGCHERVCIGSFHDERRRAVVEALSRPVETSPGRGTLMRTVLSARGGFGAGLGRVLREVDVLQIPERHGQIQVLTPRLVRAVHRLGKKIHVWTINERDDMHRLVDMGVDGIISDRADVLKDVLLERGLWHETEAVPA